MGNLYSTMTTRSIYQGHAAIRLWFKCCQSDAIETDCTYTKTRQTHLVRPIMPRIMFGDVTTLVHPELDKFKGTIKKSHNRRTRRSPPRSNLR